MAFTREILIRFPDVDFARVVYYPRFFDYCHQVFEDFFALEVGCAYPKMLQERKFGYPSVHAEADFKTPLRFGDLAVVTMNTVEVTEKSVRCRYQLHRGKGGPLCAAVEIVVACIDLDKFTGTKLPDDVRAAFERHKA